MAVNFGGIYNPLVFDGAVQEKAIELNRFLQSGIMLRDARIDAMASGAGNIGDLPFFKGMTNDEPNYSTADPAVTSSPVFTTGGTQKYRSSHTNQSWSAMDLARELGLQDPMGAIVNRVGKYWAVNTEKRVINSAQGILLDNIANDSSDMLNAIHNEEGTAAIASNKISAEAVIDAAATMGDHATELTAIAMHSVVYTNLQKLNLIDFIPDARGEVGIPTYLGYRVINDDSLTPRAGTTDGFVYTTILFSAGSVAYGSGVPETPSEVDRLPAAGNGGGQDVIYSRTTEIVHPWGFAFQSDSIAGQSPTYAELAEAAEWDRVFAQRKNIGIAFLTSNG